MGLIKYLYIVLIGAVLSLTLTAKSEPYSMPKPKVEIKEFQMSATLNSWLQRRDHSVASNDSAVKSLISLDSLDLSADLKTLPCSVQKTDLIRLLSSQYENLNLAQRNRVKEISEEVKLNCKESETIKASYLGEEDLVVDFTEE
jgi:hypothetical protein